MSIFDKLEEEERKNLFKNENIFGVDYTPNDLKEILCREEEIDIIARQIRSVIRGTRIEQYVFVAETNASDIHSSDEGTPEWIALDSIEKQKLVHDLPSILPRAMKGYHEKQPFSAMTSFDENGSSIVRFCP